MFYIFGIAWIALLVALLVGAYEYLIRVQDERHPDQESPRAATLSQPSAPTTVGAAAPQPHAAPMGPAWRPQPAQPTGRGRRRSEPLPTAAASVRRRHAGPGAVLVSTNRPLPEKTPGGAP